MISSREKRKRSKKNTTVGRRKERKERLISRDHTRGGKVVHEVA